MMANSRNIGSAVASDLGQAGETASVSLLASARHHVLRGTGGSSGKEATARRRSDSGSNYYKGLLRPDRVQDV
jgi:hypothetical protein